MKTIISVLICLALVLTFAACGKAQTENSAQSEESLPVSAEPDESSEAISEESQAEISDPVTEESSYPEDISHEESPEMPSEDQESSDVMPEESSAPEEESLPEESSEEESLPEESSAEQPSEEPSVEESSEEIPEESSEEISEEVSEEISQEPSKEESKEESSEEISEEVSEEISEEPSEETSAATLETPTVFGCTRLYDNSYVILGHCPEGAAIHYEAGGVEDTTLSDHGWFSARIAYRTPSEKVRIWAELDGVVSEVLDYKAQPKRVGSDKWDIIAGKNYQFHLDYTLQDYLHTNLYTQAQLNSLTASLKGRTEKTGAEIIYVVVPSPASVYPEWMPAEYTEKQNGDISKYDQLMQVFEDAGVSYINVKELFAAHKNDAYKLYWKTDSHWSEYGAYLVYKALFEHIAQKDPECAPRAFDEFEWKEGTYRGGDMAYYLEYADDVMCEYGVARVPKFEMPKTISQVRRYVSENKLTYDPDVMPAARTISTGRNELPSALVMRDSYSTQIYDILAERFNKTVYKGMWSYSFNAQEVNSLGVDYVIYILTERNIGGAFH